MIEVPSRLGKLHPLLEVSREELKRAENNYYWDPLSYMRRTATRDVEVGGQQIKKDDQVLMWYVSGNRDADVFENADVLDIERPNARQHLSFGFGIHRCMGNRLAELQLRVLWEEILKRFERIEVVGEPQRTFSSFVKGYTHLPVRVKRLQA